MRLFRRGKVDKMRYLVTGATGFIGTELVRQLLAEAHQVVALARDPVGEPALRLAQQGAEVRKADISDRESLREPMKGADAVFHVAGWYHVGAKDTRPALEINVKGTRNVLELMRDLEIPRGVYTSTLAVFSDTRGRVVDESYVFEGKHLSVCDLTKCIAHYSVALPLMRQGLPLTIVQPGVVYGPSDRGPSSDILRLFLSRQLPFIPGRTAYCWGHVEDIARAHLLALERGKPGETYIIAGPCHTVREALEMLHQLTGVPLPRLVMPPFALKGLAALTGLLGRLRELPPDRQPETLRVAAGATYLGSNAKARRELGMTMRPLEEGLRESLDWYLRLAHQER
jgi:nucleoside-diphosphate-sugar epimerase